APVYRPGLSVRALSGGAARLFDVRLDDGTVPGRPAGTPQSRAGALGTRAVLPTGAQALRPSAQPTRRRGRAAARRARAGAAHPGHPAGARSRAVSAVLPGGSVRTGGRRLLPHAAPAVADPDRHG